MFLIRFAVALSKFVFIIAINLVAVFASLIHKDLEWTEKCQRWLKKRQWTVTAVDRGLYLVTVGLWPCYSQELRAEPGTDINKIEVGDIMIGGDE